MPTPKLTDEQCIEALNIVEQYGSPYLAAKALGEALPYPEKTIAYRIAEAKTRNLRPTFRKEEQRIYTRQRLGRMHVWIPDVQAKAGVNTDHLTHVGNFIAEKRPDVIVCIGDFWDMPSLSSYDKGKLSFEGRRYVKDIDAGRQAMEKLLAPFSGIAGYAPRKVFCLGNHEERILRMVDMNPEFQGKFTLDDLGLKDYGWEVHKFLEVVDVDGIEASHYFTSGVMGRPCNSAAVMLRERQKSCTQGHVQTFDMAVHKKTQNIAMMLGCCYTHDEDYLTPQGNTYRRQIVVKHEVDGRGHYDPMLVSLEYLKKSYS